MKDKKYVSCKNTDPDGNIIWNCRFCKKENKSSSIYFVSSNFKYYLGKNGTYFTDDRIYKNCPTNNFVFNRHQWINDIFNLHGYFGQKSRSKWKETFSDYKLCKKDYRRKCDEKKLDSILNIATKEFWELKWTLVKYWTFFEIIIFVFYHRVPLENSKE